MADTRHEAVWDWLKACPNILDMFFNFSQSENGDTILAPLTAYSDTPVQEYTSGASVRWYDFSLIRYEALSFEPNSEENMIVLAAIEAIAAWVEAQWAAGSHPAFPTGQTIQSIEALPSGTGYVSARDETGAKYMLQFRIEYIKEV